MNAPNWRTSLAVPGLDLRTGNKVTVVVGLVETDAGGVQIGLQAGDGTPVVLALHDANQLMMNVNETTIERLRVTAETLKGDQP